MTFMNRFELHNRIIADITEGWLFLVYYYF